MTRGRLTCIAIALAGGLAAPALARPVALPSHGSAPQFKEVYELLRTHLAGATEASLNRAAVEGLLTELHGKASLVDSPAVAPAKPALDKSAILAGNVVYLRVGVVKSGLGAALGTAYRSLAATNKPIGVVLDLRFAGGEDNAAAAAAANAFISRRQPLLDWGNMVVDSRANSSAIPGPLMVLVNGETQGAAEALAAALREAGGALLIGNPTAGLALRMEEFPLHNGQRLRIATRPVKLGNGDDISRIQPDITVPVSLADERAYVKNPFAVLPRPDPLVQAGLATNQLFLNDDHLTEAELVREQRAAGGQAENVPPPPQTEPPPPVIRDPALARAVDVLKGLAVVRQARR